MTDSFTHVPVLPVETVRFLLPEGRPVRRIVDCTVGCGGHSSLLLKRIPDLDILGIDRDDSALERASANLAFAKERVHLKKGCFSDLRNLAGELGWDSVDGVLMDVGVSSPQIDDPVRGFSFRFEGPLDMRMDRSSPLSASRIVNFYCEKELARIFREYGDIDGRAAGNLAREIVRVRTEKPFAMTSELAAVCEKILRPGRGRKKGPPAPTLVFQALRIAVNGELDELSKALEESLEILQPGGRLCVISFHSLEDRIVKNFFRDNAVTCKCPPGIPVCVCGWKKKLEILTRHPVTAGEDELNQNQRSACAKLRAAERMNSKEEGVGA